jgi:DNA-directed RNA polymerase subunit RPC12/RpoP
MSEFKFVCPACGKDIKCESWRRNTMMECPSCFQRVIVPQATAGDDVELVIKGSKATRRLVTKPETNLGMPPAPTPPAKDSPVAGIAFVIILCAVIAAVFVFGGKIFKSTGGQTSGQTSQVTSAPDEKKMPPPAPPKPIVGPASVIFAKGDSLVVRSKTSIDEVKDPAKAAFLAAFKTDLASPSAFDGPAGLLIFSGYDGPSQNATGSILWHDSFQGGVVIGVTLQGLIPGHDYVLTLNGDPGHAGNNNLPDAMPPNNPQKYYDFSRVTTDMTGSYHATFGILLRPGQYDVHFFVKDTADWKIVLGYEPIHFTIE